MNQANASRTSFLGPVAVICLLAGAMHWTGAIRADAPQPAESVSVSPFMYYPAQFVNPAAEQGDALPTF